MSETDDPAAAPEEGSPSEGVLPFYVYELRHPDTNLPFYVGKGSRNRVFQHGRGLEDVDLEDIEDGRLSEKEAQIRRIEKDGQKKVMRVIIGRYATEAEAYAVEATLIGWVYGFDALTNQVRGHGADAIRDSRQKAAWGPGETYPVVPGLDVEKMGRASGGEATAVLREIAARNGVLDKLRALQNDLRAAIEDRCLPATLTVSDPVASNAQDPFLLLAGFNERAEIMLKGQLTGDHVRVNLVPPGNDRKTERRRALEEEANAANEYKMPPNIRIVPRNRGQYALLDAPLAALLGLEAGDVHTNGVPIDNRRALLAILQKAIEIFGKKPA